jgi:transcriptional regulator with XRE-family HTH domain
MANLRELRKEAGVTGPKVKAATGISPAALSKIERGHRPPSMAEVVALLRLYGKGQYADVFERTSSGAGLKAMRLAANMSQEDAAWVEGAPANQSDLSRIERGQQRASVDQVAALWDGYGHAKPAAFLRCLVAPSTSHGSSKTKAEKDATREAWKARRKGGAGGAHDVGNLAGVEPKPVVIRTPDGREFGRAKRVLEAVVQAVRPQVVPALT